MTENYKIGGGGGWNKDILGGKKIEKLTIGGDDHYSGLESTLLDKSFRVLQLPTLQSNLTSNR